MTDVYSRMIVGWRAATTMRTALVLDALAESFIGLFKTELIRRQGPWRNVDDVELATLGYIHWFNSRRLHSEIDGL